MIAPTPTSVTAGVPRARAQPVAARQHVLAAQRLAAAGSGGTAASAWSIGRVLRRK